MKPLTLDQVETMITTAMAADDWATVSDLQPRLDRLAHPRPAVRCVDAALYYAQVGLHVFALQGGAKIPHKGFKWRDEATTDPGQIVAWWQRWPDSNVAVATGHLVDVIDIDGPAGVHSWAQLEDLPPVLGTVSTPRAGGNHLYVAATGDGNAAGMFPGVDYRGLGGYVVAAPSVNADGVPYTWRRPLQLPATAAAA